MKKPRKELFDHATAIDANRDYHFLNLLGESKTYCLSWEEYLRDVKCKICGTYFVQGHGYMDSWFLCPCCHSANANKTLEEYKKEIEKDLTKNTEKIKELNEIISKEQRIIKIVEDKINK